MPQVLLYHDVISDDDDESGFPGSGAARYKLSANEFRRHLDAVAATGVTSTVLTNRPETSGAANSRTLLLTFDDGGVSALNPIADELERNGWRGHFLVTVDRIDMPGFLSAGQIRDLDARGHVIGSHSYSHPTRMAACSWSQLLNEWSKSREVLSSLLGKSISVASIPGGYYSKAVAQAAAESGLRHLFTSEPTTRSWSVDGCRVYGRFTIYRGMSAEAAASLARGAPAAVLQQAATWQAKKILKAVGGPAYLKVRQFVLDRRYS